jgi:hypothetical protein
MLLAKCELVTSQLFFPFKICFLGNLIDFFSDKNYSKFNIPLTLVLKIFKSHSLNPLIESFLTIPRAHLDSSIIFSFDLNKFSMKKLFNIQ